MKTSEYISRRKFYAAVILTSLLFAFLGFQNFIPMFTGPVTDADTIWLDYAYDPSENTTQITDQVNAGYTQSFTYDGRNRLRSAIYPNYSSIAPVPSNGGGGISYNQSGDITAYTELGTSTRSMTYDWGTAAAPGTQRILTSVEGTNTTSYTHDSYGRIKSAALNGLTNRNFTFRTNDELARLTTSSGAADYRYDSAGLRVKKVVTLTGGSARTTYYVYAGNNLMFEGSTGGGQPNETKEYFYVAGKVIATVNAASPAGCASPCTTTVTKDFYHFDPIRSTVGVSDDSGQITRERYNAYGAQVKYGTVNNATFNQKTKVRFAGHVLDEESGLIYMGKRYYDPKIARFVSTDPAGFDSNNIQSFNKYAYANNNPNKFIDPDGRWIETAWDLAAVMMDAQSLANNVTAGNVGAAVVDGIALVADLAMAGIPLVPAVAGVTWRTAAAAISNPPMCGAFSRQGLDSYFGQTKQLSLFPNGPVSMEDINQWNGYKSWAVDLDIGEVTEIMKNMPVGEAGYLWFSGTNGQAGHVVTMAKYDSGAKIFDNQHDGKGKLFGFTTHDSIESYMGARNLDSSQQFHYLKDARSSATSQQPGNIGADRFNMNRIKPANDKDVFSP